MKKTLLLSSCLSLVSLAGCAVGWGPCAPGLAPVDPQHPSQSDHCVRWDARHERESVVHRASAVPAALSEVRTAAPAEADSTPLVLDATEARVEPIRTLSLHPRSAETPTPDRFITQGRNGRSAQLTANYVVLIDQEP